MDELDDILDTRSTDLLNQLATDGKIDDEDFITLIKDLRTVSYTITRMEALHHHRN